MYLNSTTCLDFVKMDSPEKTNQLTLLNFHSKKLKQAEAEESHSDLEVEDESSDEQDLSETERDSFLPTTSNSQQDNHITVQYPSASITIIINDHSDHSNVAQDQNFLQLKLAQKNDLLTLYGMQNVSGLSTQLSRIQLFVTHVEFLSTLLVDHLKHLLK